MRNLIQLLLSCRVIEVGRINFFDADENTIVNGPAVSENRETVFCVGLIRR